MGKLLTVGTVAFDAIETPFGKTDKILGGSATFVGLAASQFGIKTGIVSIVGDDFPQEEMDALKDKGVDLQGLEIKENAKTFFWAGKYHDNMNQRDTVTTDLNVLDDFDPQLPASYEKSDYILLGNLTPAIQQQVIDQLDGNQKLVVLDTMNFWMDIALEELKKVLTQVDVLTINDEEARQLSGDHSLVKAAATIHEMGPKYLIIKKGEHGALLFSEGKIFSAPALPLAEVYDPTGAGDTFAGGFIGYMAQQDTVDFHTMKKAVIYGSVMASFCVEKFSIERLKTLTADEVKERYETFVELTAF